MRAIKDRPLPVYVAGKKSNVFQQRLCEIICAKVAAGGKLADICKAKGFPEETEVIRWYLYPDEVARPGFVEAFNRAQRISWELMAHDLIRIADDDKPVYVTRTIRGKKTQVIDTEKTTRDRLKIDTRKYVLSKRMPETFGDSIKVEHKGSIDLVARLSAGRMRLEQNEAEMKAIPAIEAAKGEEV